MLPDLPECVLHVFAFIPAFHHLHFFCSTSPLWYFAQNSPFLLYQHLFVHTGYLLTEKKKKNRGIVLFTELVSKVLIAQSK